MGSNRDRHANIGEGVLGDKLSLFVRHPKLKGLPAFLEVPGKDGHGPDADEIRKLKALRDGGGNAKPSRPSGRSRGTKARRAATRRTRG
jgi:deoxyribonuclease-4